MEKKLYFEPENEVIELKLSSDILLVTSGEDEGGEVDLGGEGSQDDFPRQ